MIDCLFFINDFDYFFSHRLNLVNELSKSKKIAVACDISQANKENLNKVLNLDIEIINLKNTAKNGVLGKAIQIRSYINHIRSKKPKNVFFVTLQSSFLGSIGSVFLKNTKVLMIIPGLGPDFFLTHFKSNLRRIIFLFSLKYLGKNSEVIVQNKDDERLFKKVYNFKKVNLISGNGININDFPFEQRKNDFPSFLFLSRLVESKGVNDFLKAASHFTRVNKKIKFRIGGIYSKNDKDSINLDEVLKICAKSDIEFIGEVKRNELKNIFHGSDVFVLCSSREGLPQTALEAASTGMPLILSNVPGCKDCIDNNGRLFNYNNVFELIKCIEVYCNNPDILGLESLNSRNMIINQFEMKLISNEYLQIMD